MVIGGGKFNNPALTPNISLLTDVQSCCFGPHPTRCEKNLSGDWELSNVNHRELVCTGSITCSWWPGGFDLCQDICSRVTFDLWSSWFSARVRSLRGCKAHKASKDMKICLLLSQCRCFGPVELHRGYSSLICTPMDEKNEFSWIQSRNWINSVFTYFFGTNLKLHPVSVKTGTVTSG